MQRYLVQKVIQTTRPSNTRFLLNRQLAASALVKQHPRFFSEGKQPQEEREGEKAEEVAEETPEPEAPKEEPPK